MKKKRTFVFSLSASLLVLLGSTPAALADSGSQLRHQINQIEKKRQNTLDNLQNNQSALTTNKKQQTSITNQVQEIEAQIQTSNYKIQVKQNSISAAQQNVQTLKNNIGMLQERIKQRKHLIAGRARAAYVSGGATSYLQILLDANDFSDFVNRLYYINQIAHEDRKVLKQQVADKQNLESDQQALEKTLNQLNSDLANLKEMKASLNSQKGKEQTLLAQLQEKGNIIQLAVTNGQQQAGMYKQQEESDRKRLSAWEKEQGIQYGSSIPSVCRIFIAPAQTLQNTTGIPAAITLSQIILESAGGGHLSELATAGKNLFGIKGQGPAGTIYLTTHEVIGGRDLTITAGFKRYNSYYQSMADHAQILQKPRYQYFLKNASNLDDYAHGIQNGGYSTDPEYAAKIMDIINAYGLSQYDTGSF